MYLIGEALVGDGPELAHVDLMIGDKAGPIGQAFANGLSQLSAGHTPLLAVVRPNLMTKPATLVIPKVSLKKGEQVREMFGPVQAAVAKAVADALEEGVFGDLDVDDLVILASIYLAPEATDYNRIYRFNYGATKLALGRALERFPTTETLLHEKDRAAHAVMGFKVQRLWDPPYLQVALDLVDLNRVRRVLAELPDSDHLIIEAGTPTIKQFGLSVISEIRKVRPNAFIVADLKTLDTGNLEARMAADATADAVVISGLAPHSTIEKALAEAKKTGIYSIIDMLNVADPVALLRELAVKPDIVEPPPRDRLRGDGDLPRLGQHRGDARGRWRQAPGRDGRRDPGRERPRSDGCRVPGPRRGSGHHGVQGRPARGRGVPRAAGPRGDRSI